MTGNERIYKNGLNKGEIQAIALYIKKKLKKKADIEKLAALRGDEAVKFYEKYYEKASELTEVTSHATEKAPVPAKAHVEKQVNLSQKIGSINKASLKPGIKASSLYADQLSKLGKLDRLVESRLNVLASLGLDFDSAMKIANSDELYTQVSHKLWG